MPWHWPRPKFTTHRIMVAVAVVAVLLGSVQWYRQAMIRQERYRFIALAHALKVLEYPPETDPQKVAYHLAMRKKYKAATNFPWFPVPPDPPKP